MSTGSKASGVSSFVFGPPRIAGLIGAVVFFWFSLTPTLLPRSWFMQAGISALSVAIGYVIGSLVSWIVRPVRTRSGANPVAGSTRRRIEIGLGAVAVSIVSVGLIL